MEADSETGISFCSRAERRATISTRNALGDDSYEFDRVNGVELLVYRCGAGRGKPIGDTYDSLTDPEKQVPELFAKGYTRKEASGIPMISAKAIATR